MAYRTIRPATHQEWLDERKKGIGSSEAGTVMGVNHFDTPYKLWRRKTGVDGPIASSEAMELGHHMEPAVVTMFAARTGAFIVKNSEGDWIAADTKKDYLRVSPDRLFYADGDKHTKRNLRILECKTTSVSVDPDDFPVYWYCQLQYQMGVMGVKKGAVAWISSYPRLNFGYKEFDFNPEFFKALEKTQSSLEDDIKIAMGEADTLVSPTGEVMALWKNTKPTMKFNAKAFQQDDPAGYAKYMEPTASTRRFSVK